MKGLVLASVGSAGWAAVGTLGAAGALPSIAAEGRGRLRSRGRGWPLLFVVVALASPLAGCNNRRGSGADRPDVTVPSGTGSSSSKSTTSTTAAAAAIDITTKPATVTVAYADAVMDELDRILSDAIREFVAANGPTKSFDDKLNAVYDEPSLENKRSVYGKLAVDGTDEFVHPPGDIRTTVRELIKTEPNCVVLRVDRDVSAQFTAQNPEARHSGFIALVPSDPTTLKRTPWSIVFDGNVLDGDDPRDAC
jgi:hypothetical protein